MGPLLSVPKKKLKFTKREFSDSSDSGGNMNNRRVGRAQRSPTQLCFGLLLVGLAALGPPYSAPRNERAKSYPIFRSTQLGGFS